jgi:hypothetical protein
MRRASQSHPHAPPVARNPPAGAKAELMVKLAVSDRSLARLFAALFAVSTAMPVIGGFIDADRYPWLGPTDVALAALWFGTAMMLINRFGERTGPDDRQFGYRISRMAATAAVLLLPGFLFFHDAIHWDVLVIGLVWRAWLLVTVAPAFHAARLSGTAIRAS